VSESRFSIALVFFVQSAELRRRLMGSLSELSESFRMPELFDGSFEFNVHWITSEAELAERAIELIYLNSSERGAVFVSDSLLQKKENEVSMTSAAEVVFHAFFVNAVTCAMISLSDETQVPAQLSAQISPTSPDWSTLRTEIERGAQRVRLLLGERRSKSTAKPLDTKFRFQLVDDPEHLLRCFEMRYFVYDLLGYLSKDIKKSGYEMELDFHDGMSLHYAAIETRTNEVAATVRLVIPHQPWGVVGAVAPDLREAFRCQQNWFWRISENVKTPSLKRKLLESGVGPLPMLQNAQVEKKWHHLMAKGLNAAEISRFIVNPRFRGGGLSKALMQLALAGAHDLGRRAAFAECFPSHVNMYAREGFQDIEGRASRFEEWGSMPLTPQKMLLEMQKPENAYRLRATRVASSLFKLANEKISRPDTSSLSTSLLKQGIR